MDENGDAPQPQPSPPSVEAPDYSEITDRVTSTLTPADEGFQHLVDRDTLAQALREARQILAQLKVAYWLARSGISLDKHPNQIAKDIETRRRWVDTLGQMWAELGDDGVVREPEPQPVSKLEIVGGTIDETLNTR